MHAQIGSYIVHVYETLIPCSRFVAENGGVKSLVHGNSSGK